MRIKETKATFTNIMNIGNFGFFIEVSDGGIILNVDDIVMQAQHFPRVIIQGEEPFNQRDEISSFVKKLHKKNPNMNYDIFTRGTVRPIGVGNFDVNYYVNIQLKNSGVGYKERVKPSILSWFIESNSKFIFYIKDKDDFDEAEIIIKDIGLSKANVYFIPFYDIESDEDYRTNLKMIYKFCTIRGYNYSFDMRRLL